ncbi:MAG: helix-turn-helix transcriptional regulator [bacterium]|nr:helix-turn-helix transcriptional regulator [bacterium]
MIVDRFLFLFIYFGGGLAILFSIGQFIRPGLDQRRIFLGLFLAAIGVIQLHAGLMHSRDILYAPHLLFLNVPALYFCGPLMAAYIDAVSRSDSRFRAGQYIQLAPGIIATLALSTIYALTADEKIALLQTRPRETYPVLLPVTFKLALVLILIYAAMGLRTLIYVLRNAESVAGYRRPLTAFLALFLLSAALGAIGYFFGSILLVRLAYVCVTLMLISLYFLGLRYPILLFHVVEGIRRQRSDLYRLQGVDLEAIDSRLKRLMESDRAYHDENLSLDDLAIALRMNPEQLSQFLNKQLGKNFSTFINEYRIKEASELLLKDPKRTVLSIAYAVGFNSSSVFHEAFRRFAGTTPGKYRRNARAPKDA